ISSSIKSLETAVVPVGDSDLIRLGQKQTASWLVQTGETLDVFGRPQVEHFERVVAECRHKEPASLHIHCEVVESPVHAWERNGLSELERRGFLGTAPRSQRSQQQYRYN